jgi:hypothetical protein
MDFIEVQIIKVQIREPEKGERNWPTERIRINRGE